MKPEKRGEVWLVDLGQPKEDQEQAGRRPAIILQTMTSLENPEPGVRRKPVPGFEIRRLLANLRASLENPQPVRTPQTVPGSKFAAFWRIFVPGSSLPLRETPTRSP